jgi:catechol 2,3-dioxygenase-like lactoylglutathione lyase family enzyme
MNAPDLRQRTEFEVGGVRLAQPFRIRRLGHFGLNVHDPEVSRKFYCGLLGFRVSDPIDFTGRLPEEETAKHGPRVGYFMRHGTDHHSFVVFPRRLHGAMTGATTEFPNITVNQITWQVGSLREVVDGLAWFKQRGKRVAREGRDTPGSNWHFYPSDPSGHINELYYGIEQVGWDGLSKPMSVHKIRYREAPTLPHRSEYAEVASAIADKVDLTEGIRQVDEGGEERFDVGGVLLARPYKVVRVGPVRLFVDDMDAAVRFYRDDLGLTITEEITWNRHRVVFMRVNTEHHSLALYPIALRAELGLSAHTTLMSFGMQVGDYQQLRESLSFLRERGITIKHLPPELFPGIDYSAFAIDPDGHAIQLYYYMEQIGWDGKPRPASARPKIDNANWPQSVAAASDTFGGEAYLGPWG